MKRDEICTHLKEQSIRDLHMAPDLGLMRDLPNIAENRYRCRHMELSTIWAGPVSGKPAKSCKMIDNQNAGGLMP